MAAFQVLNLILLKFIRITLNKVLTMKKAYSNFEKAIMRNRNTKGKPTESGENEMPANLGQTETWETVAGPSNISDDNEVKIPHIASNILAEASTSGRTRPEVKKSRGKELKGGRFHRSPYEATIPRETKGNEEDTDSESDPSYPVQDLEARRLKWKQYHLKKRQKQPSQAMHVSEVCPVAPAISPQKLVQMEQAKSQESEPFYYHVPPNPAQVNVLPPGTYLVIPQKHQCLSPLKVCHHPQAEPKRRSLKQSSTNVGTRAKVEGASAATGFECRTTVKKSRYPDANRVEHGPAATYSSDEHYRPRNTTEADSSGPRVKLLECDTPTFLRKRLPFCGIEEIRREWSNGNYTDWKQYVMDKRESTVLEVFNQVSADVPPSELDNLKRQIRGILTSYTSVKDIIAAVKEKVARRRKRKEWKKLSGQCRRGAIQLQNADVLTEESEDDEE